MPRNWLAKFMSLTSLGCPSAAAGHGVLFAVGTDRPFRSGHALEVDQVDLAIMVARIADDRAVPHHLKVTLDDDILHAGGSDEDVADARGAYRAAGAGGSGR
jgi:hypothetical protein